MVTLRMRLKCEIVRRGCSHPDQVRDEKGVFKVYSSKLDPDSGPPDLHPCTRNL